MMKNVTQWYETRIDASENELKHVKHRILFISMLRVALFLAGLTGLFFLFKAESWKLMLCIGGTFLLFLILVKVHNALFYRKEWLELQLRVNREELQALDGNQSAFEDGQEFIDAEHPYSFDLDLFGKHSLFQVMNRTCTHFGTVRLAEWMKMHLQSKKKIEERQQAIQDIASKPEFREEFRITGLIHKGKPTDEEEIYRWSQSPSRFSHNFWVKLLIWGIPITNLLLLAGGISGLISLSWFGLTFMLFLILSFGIVRKATDIQETYGKKLHTLNSYAKLIALAKHQQWHSKNMQELMNALDIEGHSPAEILMKLSKELDRLDLRNNQLLYILLEGGLFFQLHQIVRIEKWKEHYGQHIVNWMEAVGELDALCSLGTFAYNHPEYIWPEISNQPFCFKAQGMKHPLMPSSQCVKNDALIPSRPYFLIITGANMAGKSTYLRTIGTNYLLACIGCPVCCDSLILYPARLVTSLRTSDSLSDNESYFFAELKRLKRIIDWLNEKQELFIILDEILKGTNSMDKQKGSFDLIRQFMQVKANGIIATHDLLLGNLASQFPEEIRNYCFETDIVNNELNFSYKLREGIAQNMNACFLMKKMGITIQE